MKEKPRFEVVRQTPYGSELRRIKDAQIEQPTPEEEKVDRSRRGFLKRASAVAVTTAAVTQLPELLDWSGSEPSEDKQLEHDEQQTSEVMYEGPDRFAEEVAGYKELMNLQKDEVLFVDTNNQPVGRPVKLQSFEVRRPPKPNTPPEQIGLDGNRAYNLSPGHLNEIGIPEEGIPEEWLNHVKNLKQAENPDVKIADRHHVVKDFKAAYAETDEPDLVKAIKQGDIIRYIDLVKYFAEKPVRGAESFTRQEYVSQAIQFADDVPPVVEVELRRLLPGLCAQESKFNGGVTSAKGAQGIMQIMPKIWAHHGGEPGEYRSLKRQVEIAGEYLSDVHRQVHNLIGGEIIDQLQQQFSSEEAFQKDFLVPLILNSYNAGVVRVAEAVREYVTHVSPDTWPAGRELFLAVADFAKASDGGKYLSGYGDDSREYVTKIYAQAEVLHDLSAQDSFRGV